MSTAFLFPSLSSSRNSSSRPSLSPVSRLARPSAHLLPHFAPPRLPPPPRGDDGHGDNNDDNGDFTPLHSEMLLGMAALLFATAPSVPQQPPQTQAFVAADARPLVILLSWMGASPRNLKAYINHYTNAGYEVKVFVNDMATALFPPASKAQARKVVQVLEKIPDGKPVIIHAFSIGTGIYGFVLDHLRKDVEKMEKIRRNIAGVVFDSGPAMIFPKDVAKGLHAVCPAVSKAFWAAVAQSIFAVTQARKYFAQSEAALKNCQFSTPQLYFYSKDDRVINRAHEAISHFIEWNKLKGLEVYHKVWESSVHATHIRIHPEEYKENLDKFLQVCLKRFESARTGSMRLVAAQ